jgi:hypothetical protein
MVSPDRPSKLSPHRSNLPALGRRGLDDEGFFIVQPDPETDGKIGVAYSD